jgi:apolipoprotein N-acyltransferase
VRPLAPLPAAALAALGGLLVALSFPGPGLWALAPVGVAAFALAVRGQRARRGAWLGLLTGWVAYAILLHWTGIYVGNLPWLALTTLEAGFVAVAGALATLVWRHRPALVVAGLGGLWVLQEGLSSRLPFGGFPWSRLAFSQTDAPTLGLAALGGAPLVSGAVAATGGALALLVVAAADPQGPRANWRGLHWRRLAWPAATAVAVMAVGAVVPRPVDAPDGVAVSAVQGNVPHAGLDFNAERRAVLDNHVAATKDLAAAVRAGTVRAPGLVVWPENASDIDPLRNPDAATVIQASVDDVGVPIVLGAVLEVPPGSAASCPGPAACLSNTTLVWGTTTGPGARYDKRHPAPFGEYIPMRSFFRLFSDKVDLITRDFVSGTGNGVLPVTAVTTSGRQRTLRLADVICFEVAFDDLVHDAVGDGADLIVVQTNNATFGNTDESIQQLAMSRLRAVESGRAVVHVSTVGVSALIGPDGRVLALGGHFSRDVLSAVLPLRTSTTVATRLAALPEAGLALFGLAVALMGLRRRRSDGEQYPEPRIEPTTEVAQGVPA